MIKDIAKKSKSELTFKDKLYINIYDIASVLVAAVVTIMVLFTFVFRIVFVDGGSMLPTLRDGDMLVVSAYDREPEYGQVVIVTQPNGFGDPIVKRIIATENQTVYIDFSKGDVFVDGVLLNEPYINNLTINPEDMTGPVTVPEGHVFVMGDNRQGSTDSRSDMIGLIREEYILGVVKYKVMNQDDLTKKSTMYDFADWKVK
ncbi:MAG: signal peptidase I [Clostridia bacterium]|nr:signal peptidase I [Clostridia bacterium]